MKISELAAALGGLIEQYGDIEVLVEGKWYTQEPTLMYEGDNRSSMYGKLVIR